MYTTTTQTDTRAAPSSLSTFNFKPLTGILPDESIKKIIRHESVPVTELGFSSHTSNALLRAHCDTLEQLMSMTTKEIKRIREIGPAAMESINRVRSALWDSGLYSPLPDYSTFTVRKMDEKDRYASFYAFLTDGTTEPAIVMPEDYKETVHTALDTLTNDLQKEAVIHRFGLGDNEWQMAYRDIGKILSVSAPYVGYLLKRANLNLHHPARMTRLQLGNKEYEKREKATAARRKADLAISQECRKMKKEKTEQIIKARMKGKSFTKESRKTVRELYKFLDSVEGISNKHFDSDLPSVLKALGCEKIDDVFLLTTDDYLRFDRASKWDVKDVGKVCDEIADKARIELKHLQSDDDIDIIPVAFMPFNKRTLGILEKAGVITAEQIMRMSDMEFMQLPNIGSVTVGEVRRVCVKFIKDNPWADIADKHKDMDKYIGPSERAVFKAGWGIIDELPLMPLDSSNPVICNECRRVYRKAFEAEDQPTLPLDYVETLDYVMKTKLTLHERVVVMLRYGLIFEGQEKSLQDVGDLCGVVRERVRQLEAKAFEKMRIPAVSNILLIGKARYFDEHPEEAVVYNRLSNPSATGKDKDIERITDMLYEQGTFKDWQTLRDAVASLLSDPVKIEDIGLSTRAANALNQNGFHTLEDILVTPPKALAEVKGFGQLSYNELGRIITNMLAEAGAV